MFFMLENFDLLVIMAANTHGQSDGNKKVKNYSWREVGDGGEIEESRRMLIAFS